MTACPRCGEENAARSRFCWSCGGRLQAASPPGLGAERKIVTVLFVDLVGYTRLAEQLDPEDVGRLLTPYYGSVRAELERYGGTVEKFIGDAILAVFGAPVAHEDDAERALRAAFAARTAVEELNESSGGGPDLGVRIGVTTGEVLLDLSADPTRGETSVAGDVVNTAARLQQLARAGAIVVGAATMRATAHAVEYEALPPLTAKGKRQPVQAWEALSLVPTSERELRGRMESPLFGREHEMNELRRTLDQARADRSLQVVTLVGDPGVGKSRLLVELQRSLGGDEPVLWRRGRCLPYGARLSFWAFAEIVKAQAGILETDRAEVAAERLHAAVRAAVAEEREAGWVERHLRPLVGLEGDALDRRESFAAWRRFVAGVAASCGLLVLAVEDVQWGDDGLLDLLEHIVEWESDASLVLLCTARPELLDRRPEWPGVRRVEPLSSEAMVELLGALLTGTPIPGEVWSRLLSQTGGNPLYAEEYARMLVQGAPEGELPLPESVHALISARLDALDRQSKTVLQDAAVVGKEFWVGPLEALAGLERKTVERRLSELERKGFIAPQAHSAVAEEPQYAFSHVLIRDIAYGQIPRSRRTEKHRLAGDWIAGLAPDRASNLAEMTAHHYASALEYARLSGQPSEALAEHARLALEAAGDHASQLSAFASAERFYADALALLPDGHGNGPSLRLRLGTSRFRAEGSGEQELEDACRQLLDQGDPEAAAEAAVLVAELRFRRGNVSGAFEMLEAALGSLAERPPSRQKALAFSSLSRFRTAGEPEEAIRIGREALAMAEALELPEVRAHALNNIGTSRVALGDHGGVSDLEESVEISAALGSVEAVRGYLNLGTTLANLGDLRRAFAVHAQGRRVAKRFGDAIGIRWFAIEQLFEDYWRGRWAEAQESADRLLGEIAGEADYYTELGARIVRGWIRLARGDTGGAREDTSRHLDLAREVRYPQALFPALAQAARMYATTGARDRAERYAGELLHEWRGSIVETATYWAADLAFALVELGRGADLVDVGSSIAAPTAWLEAACTYAAGDASGAADRYRAIGSLPDEAFARIRAGEGADSFVRRVGAVGYAAASPSSEPVAPP